MKSSLGSALRVALRGVRGAAVTPVADLTDDELRRERARASDAIDAAFWRFTMCRRAPPPPVAVPWAYALRWIT